jgi:chromosome partitioning protein
MKRDSSGRRTHVIAVGNQKGGVGKTTSCVNLATALAELGRKSLIWDLDSNCGSTRHFGIPEEAKFFGTFEVLTGREKALDVIITGEEDDVDLPQNVHLIPARRNLEGIDAVLREADKFFVPRDILIEPMKDLRGLYDYIFLDTAPHATTPTIASYMAADFFILAAIPEHFAIDGLKAALDDIRTAQRRGNSELELLGVVLSCVNKRYRTAQLLTGYVARTFTPEGERSLKFDTEISRAVAIPQAQQQGKSIFQMEPGHKVAEEYRQLAREIETRIARFIDRRSNHETGGAAGEEAVNG